MTSKVKNLDLSYTSNDSAGNSHDLTDKSNDSDSESPESLDFNLNKNVYSPKVANQVQNIIMTDVIPANLDGVFKSCLKFGSASDDQMNELYSKINPCKSSTDTSTENKILKRKISKPSLEPHKKSFKKKAVSFGVVNELVFVRQQGNVCVPTKGGTTLGMSEKHEKVKIYTVDEYEILKMERSSQKKPSDQSSQVEEANCDTQAQVKRKSRTEKLKAIPDTIRRIILKESGVDYIDENENEECNLIRSSRESCGCNCKNYCDKDVCACILSEIPCIKESLNFPCSCPAEKCGNPFGSKIYNYQKIQNHYLKTIKKFNKKS